MYTNPYPSITIGEVERNTGDAIARRVEIVGDLFYGPKGIETEDKIFRTLSKRTDKSSFDQVPHDLHLVSFGGLGSPKLADGSPMTPENAAVEGNKIFAGTELIYIASRTTYYDEKGGIHHSEQCMVGRNLEDSMGFCLGHNGKD
jgi:hypothetical protein